MANLIKTTSSSNFTPPTTFTKMHHSPPYSILHDSSQGLHPNGIFFLGLPSGSPKTGMTFIIPKLWLFIFIWNMWRQYLITFKKIFTMVHGTPIKAHLTLAIKELLVESQISNLTPDLYFDYNSCISNLSEQDEDILGI